nr:hypothetical protein [Tanacetum cinerariifolium]
MVGAGHAAYIERFHELDRLVPHLVTPESRKIKRYVYSLASQIREMVEATEAKTMQISGALTDKAVRNGSIKKVEKRGNAGEPSKDKNYKDDNKRTRIGNAFVTTANPVGEDNTCAWPKCTTCNSYHASRGTCRTCFNYNRPGHFVKDCRVVPRNVNPGNGHGNQGNQARGREFMLEAEEARLEPNELGFRYKIEKASGQLVEIDKVIKGCKLEIEGHVFDIDLIPFEHESYDVIIGERPKEKVSLLMSAKASDKEQEEIVVVIDFPEVFLDDLSGLPPLWKIEFRIELIPVAIPVTKSPYRLAPSELEELFIENFSKIAKPLTILTRKCKTFDWGKEQELAFQTLKDMLCNAPVLALLDGPEDFVRRWIELFSDYDCEIRYHPGKVNMVADALSRKERINPKRVRVMNMTLQSSIKDRILAAQKEAVDESARLQKGADKIYYDLKDRYWWPGMKKDIAVYVKRIAMDFVTKFPRTSSGHDTIWVIVDRLTKSAHFLPMLEDYKMDRLARLYLNAIVSRHDVPISIIFDNDNRFTSRLWQSMQEALGTREVGMFIFRWFEFSFNNSYHFSVRCAPFEALYGRKCRSSIMWAEVREGQLIGHELVQENTEKISQTKDRLMAARDRQKSYADKSKKPLEFSVGPVAYRLDLHEELDGVHDTFHVSNLKKCLADPTLQVPLDEIQVELCRKACGNFGKRAQEAEA